MNEPIRVLQVLHSMDCGGAENMIMNLYRNIDRDKVQFDFLVHTKKKCFFDDEIKSLGGRIFHVPYFNVMNYFTYNSILNNFFKKHPEISIVHGHLGSCAHIYLNVAKKHGCFTIAHSHNTLPTNKSLKNTLYRIFSLQTRKVADFFMACGLQAGKDRYGDNIVSSDHFFVLNNAIDTNKYLFNPEIRAKKRKELKLDDKIVIGHIGRFNYQKNHEYLIDVFNEFQKKETNAILLLVGDGDLRSQIENKVTELGLSERVIFAGIRKDVPEILQAMDCFVFPSHYEGLPVTVIEAQAAGLRCIISDLITKEVVITDYVKQLSLDSNVEQWCDYISKSIILPREDTSRIIAKAGYSIKDTAIWLVDFYQSEYKTKGSKK